MQYLVICLFLGTKVLVAGGRDESYKLVSTSYILEVFFDDTTSITKIQYKDLPNVPNCFSNSAFGNFRGRSLIIGGFKSNGQCFEFDQEKFHFISSLNVNRGGAASTFIENKVVVAGGRDDDGISLDTIEILDWDESNHESQWIEAPSKLPIKVSDHTMVTFKNKLYLIGGYYQGSGILSGGRSNKNWQGYFDKPGNEISWVEMGLRLQKKRAGHFSFVISNQIIIFGGYNEDDDVVEIIGENELKQGPKVPFRLRNDYDQAVLDRNNRIIITSKDHGLIIYDHQAETFTPYNIFKLKEYRKEHSTILQ